MHYQQVIDVLQAKTQKVVENVNEHLNTDKKTKEGLNDLKDMLETYKKFIGQYEDLKRLLQEDEDTKCTSLMEKVQRMKLLDREKAKMSIEYDILNAKVENVKWKMGQLCPACRAVFNEVIYFMEQIKKEGCLVKLSDRFPAVPARLRKKMHTNNVDGKTDCMDKCVQVDIPVEKNLGLTSKVGRKVIKLAKQLDIVLI